MCNKVLYPTDYMRLFCESYYVCENVQDPCYVMQNQLRSDQTHDPHRRLRREVSREVTESFST